MARPHKRTILVVEDDPAMQRFYETAITTAGYSVQIVEDGLDALHRLDTEAPVAVILDLRRRRLNRRDVRRELASHIATRDVPIIIVTADRHGLDPLEFPWVLKAPVTVEALTGAMANWLEMPQR